MIRREHGWLALGAIAYAAVLVAAAISARLPADPGISATTSPHGTVVAWVLPGSAAWDAGIRPGDQLPAGPPLPGAPIAVVRAQGGPFLLDPERWRLRGLSAAGLLVAGGLLLLVSWSALVRTHGTPEARALVAPFLIAGTGLLALPAVSAMRAWALALIFGCVLALGPAFLAACWYFVPPEERWSWRRAYPAIIRILAVGAAVAYVAAFTTGGATYPAARLLGDACLAGGVVGGSLLVIRRWVVPRTKAGPGAAAVVLLGMALGLLPLTALIIGPHLRGRMLTSPTLAAIGLLLFPAAYAYAVQRHHLLGLPSIWDRGLTRAIGAAVLAALYLLIFGALLHPLLAADEPGALLPLALAVFALGMSVLPVARAAASGVDRLLFHDAYSQRDAVRQLVDTVGAAADIRDATTHALDDVRRWLHVAWLAVLTRRHATGTVVAVAGALPAEEQSRLAATLAANVALGALPAGLEGAGIASFPVHLGTDAIAVLLAGPKANGEPLRRGDRDVLAALATMLGAPLGRDQLLLEAQERVAELERHKATLQALSRRLIAAQETERQRLAVELHDGPLQRLHYLLRLLDGDTPRDDCHEVAAQVGAELRATCLALRPPALDELGLPAALASLARHVERQAGCPIRVAADGYIRGRLARDPELALYRIAREALNNCARHSGAAEVAVTVRQDTAATSVTIRDDGMGFETGAGACPTAADSEHRLGLLEMDECARAWGGALTIDAAPGRGTAVRAVLPCARTREVSA